MYLIFILCLVAAASASVCPTCTMETCPEGQERPQDSNGCLLCECAPAPCSSFLVCDPNCEYSTEPGPDGCPFCVCNSACPLCKMEDCPEGQHRPVDSIGCRLCECGPAPCAKSIMCDSGCEFSTEPGPDGCPTCVCNTVCPTCKMEACPEGQARPQDSNGCLLCECAPACPMCKMEACPEGQVRPVDSIGCPLCECGPAPCAKSIMCDTGCEYSTEPGPDGCPTCVCDTACPMCKMEACPEGQARPQDSNGCLLCECAPACPMCKMEACPEGQVRPVDSIGCPLCECGPAPCAKSIMCDSGCEYSTEPGPDGCPTCVCNSVPPCSKRIHCRSNCVFSTETGSDGCPFCVCP